jgi:uncharacterized membrane protein YphA (DoxX/SURF4 family)
VCSTCPRRHRLQKLFSAFPDSWAGLGLVILRLTIAFSGVVQGISIFTTSSGAPLSFKILGLGSICLSLVLVIGFLTPVVGSIATLCYLISGFELFVSTDTSRYASALTALQLTVMSLILVLLGPGAYSVDARLFGRREIIIPDGRRPRQ